MKSYVLSLLLCLIAIASVQSQCVQGSAHEFLDINNVRARINNGGDMWWDWTNDAQYEVPAGGGLHSLFAGALWIGGIDNYGQLKVAAATYRQNGNDFFPGPLNATGQTTPTVCQNFDRMWKVNKSTIDSFNNGLFSTPPNSILEWPGKGNPYLSFLPNQDLAPFVDINNDNTYNPNDGDYPSIKGDQSIWWVYNDNGNAHSESGGTPLQIEIQVMAFATNNPQCELNNATFYEFTIINKSNISLSNVFSALWVDPNLGNAIDDYIGSDSIKNMAISYNSDSVDGCTFGYDIIPILGIKVLEASHEGISASPAMSKVMIYNNDFTSMGNPEDADDYYNYMQAIYKDGAHLTCPLTGYTTNYANEGDPSLPGNCSACAINQVPGDERMLVTSGPFSFQPGEKIHLVYAVIWVQPPVGTYPCPSFSHLNIPGDCIQALYNAGVFSEVSEPQNILPQISLYPNPANNELKISFADNKEWQIQVFNLQGQEFEIPQSKTETEITLQTSSLPASVYFIEARNTQGTVSALKFIKE